MMNQEKLKELHADVAKELYLDMMAGGVLSAGDCASNSIREADVFIGCLLQSRYQAVEQAKTKGCAACYGSGGKRNKPCVACNGSGRVAV